MACFDLMQLFSRFTPLVLTRRGFVTATGGSGEAAGGLRVCSKTILSCGLIQRKSEIVTLKREEVKEEKCVHVHRGPFFLLIAAHHAGSHSLQHFYNDDAFRYPAS